MNIQQPQWLEKDKCINTNYQKTIDSVAASDECRDCLENKILANSGFCGYNKQLVFKWSHKDLKGRIIRT